MKEVTYTEFHAYIGNKNTKISVIGKFPYTNIFKVGGIEVGKIIESYGKNKGITIKKYYLNN